jgi:hypothetical protein
MEGTPPPVLEELAMVIEELVEVLVAKIAAAAKARKQAGEEVLFNSLILLILDTWKRVFAF